MSPLVDVWSCAMILFELFSGTPFFGPEDDVGALTDEELRARFREFDADDSGFVDIDEYLQFSLRDALARSADRVIDLFRCDRLYPFRVRAVDLFGWG